MTKHHVPATKLDTISARTLSHYQANAAEFWEGTRDHDVTQNYAAIIDALGGKAKLRILDFGCGPGRDLRALRELGHLPTGLDGCEAFVDMARASAGCEVLHQNFFELNLPATSFDGIFANASLFHIPFAELPRALSALRDALVAGGVLFCSNPRSFDEDQEGWNGERYGTYLTRESWARVIGEAGFTLEREYLRPANKRPEEQPWLAMIWRKH
ncbi:MAG: class I SAM-dependent methyltransferase [Sandaracinaceae bacterium]|nr:class I SAM-dependent methyltransferase [Sandaracinaceae bacterium]